MPYIDNPLNPTGYPDYIWELEHPDAPPIPAWVPADAKIHIDFLGGTPQGRAWIAGTGDVGIATLLGNDPAVYDYVPNDTDYNSSRITSNGYDPRASGMQTAYIGAAKTKILSGATIRFVQKRMTVNTADATVLKATSANGDEQRAFDVVTIHIGVDRDRATGGGTNNSDVQVLPNIINGIEVLALTFTNTRMEMAAMGHANEDTELVHLSFAVSEFPMIGAWFDYAKNYATVQSITIYDPLPTTAGLAELSGLT